MRVSYKSRLLSAVFLASLAVLPCWSRPIPPPQTPARPTLPQTPARPTLPQTPAQPQRFPSTPDAPARKGQETQLRIEKYLREWIKTSENIVAMPYTKGGAEAWVQFEFETMFKRFLGLEVEKNYNFREQRVYKNANQAADWVFDPSVARGAADTKGLIVELKVESSMQVGGSLITKIKADQAKVNAGYKDKYQGFDTKVLGIAWDTNTQKDMEGIDMHSVQGAERVLKDGRVIKLYEWEYNPNSQPTQKKVGGTSLSSESSEAESSDDASVPKSSKLAPLASLPFRTKNSASTQQSSPTPQNKGGQAGV